MARKRTPQPISTPRLRPIGDKRVIAKERAQARKGYGLCVSTEIGNMYLRIKYIMCKFIHVIYMS